MRRSTIPVRLAILVAAGLLGPTFAVPLRAEAAWYTFHRLIPSPTSSFYFGAAMAAVDDDFLVGDPGDSSGGPFTGAVHLIDARTGAIVRTIVHPDPQPYAQFGLAVALRGPDIVVAAPQQPVGGAPQVGAVYVFEAATGALRFTIDNPAPAANDGFGQALSASADAILVGARGDGDPPVPGAPSPGAAYLFDGESGALQRSFSPPGPAVLSFGSAVGFAGSDPLVGAVNDSSVAIVSGGAYRFDAATGDLLATMHSPTPHPGAGFGSRVAAVGDQPVIASVFDNLARPGAGAIYLFDAAGTEVRAFPNPAPENVAPPSSGQVTLDAIDDRLLAAGFYHYSDLSTPGGDSVYVIDSVTGEVLQTLVGPAPFGTELAATSLIATGGRIVVSSFGQLFVFDPAGNSYLALGEECDDGNTADGDGCSSRSRREVPACPPAPRSDCHTAAPGAGGLAIVDWPDDGRDRLAWRMASPTGAGKLGDPSVAGNLHVCVYDGSALTQPRRALAIPAGTSCGAAPCWTARGSSFLYRDRAGSSDGVTRASLRRPASGQLRAVVEASGIHLHPPALPLVAPVLVQLSSDAGSCWTSTFSSATTSGSGRFRARADR